LAFLCWRENFIGYKDELTPEDLDKTKSREPLLRSELSVLLGLMVKSTLDIQKPAACVIETYINNTEVLLSELHMAMSRNFIEIFKEIGVASEESNPLTHGNFLREPFFYSGESAYMFQYRDFSIEKYKNDEKWFLEKKGFSSQYVKILINSVSTIQIGKIKYLRKNNTIKNLETLTLLPVFTLTIEEVAKESSCPEEIIKNIFESFSLKNIPCNQQFTEIGAFNEVNAYPIISLDDEKFIIFINQNFAEAFYETPFFWMMQDKDYAEKSKENRGLFTEHFSAERLKHVLGAHRVYENVYIYDSKGQIAGEIDVLAVFADRAVVLQAKSKRLTEASRKGSDNAIKEDFQKAIQDSYNQGLKCANLLCDNSFLLTDRNKNNIHIRRDFAEVFIFCVVSDHYPALAYQADQFLEIQRHEIIKPPYVMDVFFLDVLCEMLDSPLHFFNFLHRRSTYFGKLKCSHEITVLSYHLAYNLWIQDKYNWAHLDDSISANLDAAMLVRREGLPGKRIPEGILTRLKGSIFEHIINHIGSLEYDKIVELGYFLLEFSEETANEFHKSYGIIIRRTQYDGRTHNFSMAVGKGGITIYASYATDEATHRQLHAHCIAQKYSQKAERWFGLVLNPACNPLIQLAVGLDYPWEPSEDLELFVKQTLPQKGSPRAPRGHRLKVKKKTGRNEPCPCGSGKKYKKCCLSKY
jgi:hypothetical protein